VLNVSAGSGAWRHRAQRRLLNMNNRWVGVNWRDHGVHRRARHHVLGDATFPAPLMPKSGHMANQHAKVAAAAIISCSRAKPSTPRRWS